MAVVTDTVGEGKSFSVTENGLLLTLAIPSTKINLRADPANDGDIEYSFDDAGLVAGSARADDAAIRAGGYMYLEPGDAEKRENMNCTKVYLRTSAGKTEVVKVQTK